MSTSLLRVEDLGVGYASKLTLCHLDFSLHCGEVLAILGANGTGKTTLLKTLMGLIPAIEGRIMTPDNQSASALMAYVPQSDKSIFAFTVFEMVLMGRSGRLPWYKTPGSYDRHVAEQALSRLGIESLMHRDYTTLSGGERQLVLIARALTEEKPILVLDEPTASLDFGNQIRVLETLMRLAQEGLGIIMTTHNPDHARQVAHRVLLVDKEASHEVGDTSLLTRARLARLYRLDEDQLTRFGW